MNLKYYLRGLGLGIVLTAVLLGIISGEKGDGLSDAEIILRAKSLGMIEESELPEYIEEAGELAEAELRAEIEGELRESLRQEIRAEVEAGLLAQPEGESGENSGLQEPGTGGETEGAARDEGDGDLPAETGAEDSRDGSGAADAPGGDGAAGNTGTGRTGEDGGSIAGTAGTAAGAPTVTGVPDSVSVTGIAGASGAAEGINGAGETAGGAGQEAGFVEFIVGKGEMAREISRGLESAGLVESASDFENFLLRNGYDRFIKASKYRIPIGADAEQIADIITNYGAD